MSIANSDARGSNPAVESKIRKNSDGQRSEGDNILANASLFTSMLDWSTTQRPFGTLRFLSAAMRVSVCVRVRYANRNPRSHGQHREKEKRFSM